MKKSVLICIMVLTALGVNAQRKGDFLLMKGAGVGDGYMDCEHETGNCVLVYEGKKQNGFMLISFLGEGTNVHGWVSSKYLRKVCPSCEGYPKTYDDCDKENPCLLKVCKKCNGRGY